MLTLAIVPDYAVAKVLAVVNFILLSSSSLLLLIQTILRNFRLSEIFAARLQIRSYSTSASPYL